MANEKTQPRAALITGAGRRIGRAIALTLAQAGYAAPDGADASIVNIVDQCVLTRT